MMVILQVAKIGVQQAMFIPFGYQLLGAMNLLILDFLPKSHKREFKKYLPENTKFTKGEFRLDENISDSEFIRPEVIKKWNNCLSSSLYTFRGFC